MTKPRSRTSSPTVKLTGGAPARDLMLTPMVIAMRMPVLLAEAAHGSITRPEANRAVNEKVLAGFQGTVAMHASMMRSVIEFWPSVMRGRHPGGLVAGSVVKAGNEALRPASRTVRSNFDRLRKG
ncbi:MAG: hypothetical protein KDJ73_12030 [Notoacmeibacter sp.]|nr:hypothetical protein [Notoacmeibacter sp.]MCC0032171.1 hypothetical protein [Brucellaceae bacterium]